MRALEHWGNVANWTVGFLLSIATPATADIIEIDSRVNFGDRWTVCVVLSGDQPS